MLKFEKYIAFYFFKPTFAANNWNMNISLANGYWWRYLQLNRS